MLGGSFRGAHRLGDSLFYSQYSHTCSERELLFGEESRRDARRLNNVKEFELSRTLHTSKKRCSMVERAAAERARRDAEEEEAATHRKGGRRVCILCRFGGFVR